MRLSILSNVNLDMLSGLLKKENEVFHKEKVKYHKKRAIWIIGKVCYQKEKKM